MRKPDEITNRLKEIALELAASATRMAELATDRATADLLDHENAIQLRLGAERQRLLSALRAGESALSERPSVSTGGRPLRELALDVVDTIGVPTSAGLLAEFGRARFGVDIPSARLASIRRDEERAWRTDPRSRPSFLVPALLADTLTAVPRLLTSSAWELERRIVASRSLRAHHLKSLISMCVAIQTVRPADHAASARLESLAIKMAASVPGALGDRALPFDSARVRQAAQAELETVEQLDSGERSAAAARAAKLGDYHRVWGAPALIPGSRERASR